MIKQKKGSLCVETDGRRHFISVPAGSAQELYQFLRNNRVHAASPEPAFTGFDSIELSKETDVDGVQTLLNSWKEIGLITRVAKKPS